MINNDLKSITHNDFGQELGLTITNWAAKAKPAQISLEGTYCILRPITAQTKLKELYESFNFENDGSSWTYLPYGPFTSLDEFKSWLATTLAKEVDTQLYTVEKINDPRPLGIIGYLRINPEHGVIEIGHVHFSKLLQKTSMATEAIYLMINHALKDLAYRRCEWKCNSLNKASVKTALRIGFQFEGTFRQTNVFKNQNRDTSWFSIIDSEWQSLARRLEAWLQASNFDDEGKQRRSLQEFSLL